MTKELFGIKALERWFESFLKASQTGESVWFGGNFQPGHPIGNSICPHYQLLEICAEVMEIKKNELVSFSHFCGVVQRYIMVGGPDGRRREMGGIEKNPFRVCEVIANLMEITIQCAGHEKPKPIKKISEFPDKKEREEIKNYLLDSEAFEIAQKILMKWRSGIPQIILMEKEFSDIELISTAKNLQRQLKKQAVDECEQAPKHYYNQWLHID